MMKIPYADTNYPLLLKSIYSPPRNLFVKGNVDLLKKRCISIVGTRNSTEYADWVIKNLLNGYLKDLNICCVSGMALGVDTLVHKRCLEVGIPTIAVIAGGIDNVYPRCNANLYAELVEKGLVIAEYDGIESMHKGMFPRRNRILAGLSEMTLVVEADVRSGSLLTAHYALEFNRDVYAVPGYISKYTSHGCNMLIKEGAGIITSRDDFEQLIGIEHGQLKMSI